MDGVSAFVLAGGRSVRMGTNKAMLRLGDRTFLQIALENAKAVSARPVIVGSRSLYGQYGDVIEDRISGCGPLSGIHAALAETASELNIILSVDMPLMDPKFLRWLVAQAAETREWVTVPRSGGRLQPLCAVYRRASLGAVERALKQGQFKVEAALDGARVIQEAEIESAGFSPAIFCNVNQPWEYEGLTQPSVEAASANGTKR